MYSTAISIRITRRHRSLPLSLQPRNTENTGHINTFDCKQNKTKQKLFIQTKTKTFDPNQNKQTKTKQKLLNQTKTKTFDPNQNKQTKTKQKLLIRQDTADTRYAEQRDHRTHSRPRKHGRHRRPRTDRKNRTRRKHRKRKPIPAANPTKTRSQVLCDNPSGGNEEKKRRSVIRSRNRANQGNLTSQCKACLSIKPGGKDVRHRR
jgi:hypothetical protein